METKYPGPREGCINQDAYDITEIFLRAGFDFSVWVGHPHQPNSNETIFATNKDVDLEITLETVVAMDENYVQDDIGVIPYTREHERLVAMARGFLAGGWQRYLVETLAIPPDVEEIMAYAEKEGIRLYPSHCTSGWMATEKYRDLGYTGETMTEALARVLTDYTVGMP